MVTALRAAMAETQALVRPNSLNRLLSTFHMACCSASAICRKPTSPRALASAPANILPVRGEWIDDGRRPPRLSDEPQALLTALEPLIEGDQADQAATAALALRSGRAGISNWRAIPTSHPSRFCGCGMSVSVAR